MNFSLTKTLMRRSSSGRLALILLVMLGLMLILIYAEFALTRHALLILGVVPLATLGGLIALHITGATLNVAILLALLLTAPSFHIPNYNASIIPGRN